MDKDMALINFYVCLLVIDFLGRYTMALTNRHSPMISLAYCIGLLFYIVVFALLFSTCVTLLFYRE